MKTKHSPAPWTMHREDPASEWLLIMSGGPAGRIVANVNAESCPDISSAPAFVQMPQDANGRLIAAAPELLAALISALSVIPDPADPEVHPDEFKHMDGYQKEWNRLFNIQARAAIAKATSTE